MVQISASLAWRGRTLAGDRRTAHGNGRAMGVVTETRTVTAHSPEVATGTQNRKLRAILNKCTNYFMEVFLMVELTVPASDGWEEIGNSAEIMRWEVTGTQVVGKLVSIDDVLGVNGRPCKEATVTTSDGKKRFYLSTNLQEKLTAVPIGYEVKIEFLGKVPTMRGMMMKKFKVQSRKPEAAQSIDDML